QVAVAQDSDQAAFLGDRKATNFLAFHFAGRLIEVVVGTDDRDLAAHQVLRGFAPRIVSFRDAADHDVAVGNHADHQAAVFDHRDEPGAFLLHLPGDVEHLVILFGRLHCLGHCLTYLHGIPPWGVPACRRTSYLSTAAYRTQLSTSAN